jgi:hypothetical protein
LRQPRRPHGLFAFDSHGIQTIKIPLKRQKRGDQMSVSYEKDFYGWCNEQAADLLAGRLEHLDLRNLAEEIECLGKQWKRELRSRFKILFLHLLKWEYSPSDVREYSKKSWLSSIRCQQKEIPEFLDENPSLQSCLEECVKKAYEIARFEASLEGKLILADLPIDCPYDLQDALKKDWLPKDRW